MTVFPWQINQWQRLYEAFQKNQLPHALLLLGASGLGKNQFAQQFSSLILCDQQKACGQCHACYLFQAKSHPDFMMIELEQKAQMIKIDQIRQVVSFINETAMIGAYKVVMIHPAHAMNLAAANALLKTLEEPAPNAILILISDQVLRLPITITSRCQKVIFQKPAQDTGINWLKSQITDPAVNAELLLKIAEGAPLKAIEWLNQGVYTLRNDIYQGLSALSQHLTDPLSLAAEWQEFDLMIVYSLLLNWLRDLLRFKLTSGTADLINDDYQTLFNGLIPRFTLKNIVNYLNTVQQSYANILNLQSLNKQLLLEELLINYSLELNSDSR